MRQITAWVYESHKINTGAHGKILCGEWLKHERTRLRMRNKRRKFEVRKNPCGSVALFMQEPCGENK